MRIVDSRDNEVVFVPPPADQLPVRLQKLVDFANADTGSESFIHPLVRAAILHFWVAYEILMLTETEGRHEPSSIGRCSRQITGCLNS